MFVLDKLACSLGRGDEIPNRELAQELVENKDQAGIAEIANNLWNKDRNIQADCIKVMDEVGYLKPEWIVPYAPDLIRLLKSHNNRMVWGAMIALSTIGALAGDELYPHAKEIQKAMKGGSVITRDAGVLVLAGIASGNVDYNRDIFPYLLDHLRTCRPKDVPQHSEKTLLAVNSENKATFISVLEKRMEDLRGRQVKRVEKVIRQAQQR